ncbi:hypothetical protein K2173_017927 [Erythroxylum novogranatense]|uniref:Uncharacterized protein n=1 Tax=Erythroxylum novogranatense TaxID=1862640 RepID=A0AAV8TP05_9ROSI|nr:hypothetical protein K2173_017927 [Erythroxylum novogranatense]
MNTSYSSFSPNQLASFFVLPPDCIFLATFGGGSYTSGIVARFYIFFVVAERERVRVSTDRRKESDQFNGILGSLLLAEDVPVEDETLVGKAARWLYGRRKWHQAEHDLGLRQGVKAFNGRIEWKLD